MSGEPMKAPQPDTNNSPTRPLEDKELELILTKLVTATQRDEIVIGKVSFFDQAYQQINALIDKRVVEAVKLATSPRTHLLKTEHVTFCGWGSTAGVEIVEIIEDATCKTCIKLATQERNK